MRNSFKTIKRLLEELLPNKKIRIISAIFVITFVVVGVLLVVHPAAAQAPSSVLSLEGIGNAIIWAVSKIMLWVSKIAIAFAIYFLRFFIELAGYNNYINAPTVMVGWVMVRDVANMFFVVVLLAIAIGTILGLEQYEWKKTLVKFILSAVFINFSNLICGLIIDVAHVFTITFLNAVVGAAGGNFINMFKLDSVYKMTGTQIGTGEGLKAEVFIGVLSGMIFAVLAAVTIGAYVVVMAARVVVLWVLIILSPLAYILQVIPQTQQYAGMWWDKFGKQVMVAPIMVFFLWLAFATLGNGSINKHLGEAQPKDFQVTNDQDFGSKDILANLDKETSGSATPAKTENRVSLSDVTTWENMSDFFIATAFLLIGIQIVNQMGVVGGSLVNKGVDFAKKVATIASGYAAGRFLAGAAWKGAKLAAYHAPVLGGKKWENLGKTIGANILSTYRRAGTGLTKKGLEAQTQAAQKRGELYEVEHAGENKEANKKRLSEIDRELGNPATSDERKEELNEERERVAKAVEWGENKTPEERKQEAERLGGEVKALEETAKGATGNVAYKALGWFARQGVRSEKHLKKSAGQAETLEKILFKRVGAEAGGWIFNRLGTIGGRGGQMLAQDRMERGILEAEEMRSKAKDQEFMNMGKAATLGVPRQKWEGQGIKGMLGFRQKITEPMAEAVAGHEARARGWDSVHKSLMAGAKITVDVKAKNLLEKAKTDPLLMNLLMGNRQPANAQEQNLMKQDGAFAKALYQEEQAKLAEGRQKEMHNNALKALAETDVGKDLYEQIAEAEIGGKIGEDFIKALKNDKLKGEFERAKKKLDEVKAITDPGKRAQALQELTGKDKFAAHLEYEQQAQRAELDVKDLKGQAQVSLDQAQGAADWSKFYGSEEKFYKLRMRKKDGEQLTDEEEAFLADKERVRELQAREAQGEELSGEEQAFLLDKKDYVRPQRQTTRMRMAEAEISAAGSDSYFKSVKRNSTRYNEAARKLEELNEQESDLAPATANAQRAEAEAKKAAGDVELVENEREVRKGIEVSLGDKITEAVAEIEAAKRELADASAYVTEAEGKLLNAEIELKDAEAMPTGTDKEKVARDKAIEEAKKKVVARTEKLTNAKKDQTDAMEAVPKAAEAKKNAEAVLERTMEESDSLIGTHADRYIKAKERQEEAAAAATAAKAVADDPEVKAAEEARTARVRAERERLVRENPYLRSVIAEKTAEAVEQETKQGKARLTQGFMETTAGAVLTERLNLAEQGAKAAEAFLKKIKDANLGKIFLEGENELTNMLRKAKEASHTLTEPEIMQLLKRRGVGAKVAYSEELGTYYTNLSTTDKTKAIDKASDAVNLDKGGSTEQDVAVKKAVAEAMKNYEGVEREQGARKAVDEWKKMIYLQQKLGKEGKSLDSLQEARMMGAVTFLVKNGWFDDGLGRIIDVMKEDLTKEDQGLLRGEEADMARMFRETFTDDKTGFGFAKVTGAAGNRTVETVNRSGGDRANVMTRLSAYGADVGLVQSESSVLRVRRAAENKGEHLTFDQATARTAETAAKKLVEAMAVDPTKSVDEVASSMDMSAIAQELGMDGKDEKVQRELRNFVLKFVKGKVQGLRNVAQVTGDLVRKMTDDFLTKVDSHGAAAEYVTGIKDLGLASTHVDDVGHIKYDMESGRAHGQLYEDAESFVLGDWRKIDPGKRMSGLKIHAIARMNEDTTTASHFSANAMADTYAGVTTELDLKRQDVRNKRCISKMSSEEKARFSARHKNALILGDAKSDISKTYKSVKDPKKRQQVVAKDMARDWAVALLNAPQALLYALGQNAGIGYDQAMDGQTNVLVPEPDGSGNMRHITDLNGLVEWIEDARGGATQYDADSKEYFKDEDRPFVPVKSQIGRIKSQLAACKKSGKERITGDEDDE